MYIQWRNCSIAQHAIYTMKPVTKNTEKLKIDQLTSFKSVVKKIEQGSGVKTLASMNYAK